MYFLVEAASELDLESDKSCGSDCECQTNHAEFEVVSSSSSCHNIDSNTSDSSTLIDFEVKFRLNKNIVKFCLQSLFYKQQI